jgi:hypothetical protein
MMSFKFATDSEVGTFDAVSFDAACERLQAMVPPAAIQAGAWGWVEDVDGSRFEVGAK